MGAVVFRLGIGARKGVADRAHGMAETLARYDGVDILRLEYLIFICLRNSAFLGNQKSCSDLNADRAQHERRRDLSAVADAARSDYGNGNRVNDLGHQRHRGQLADVTAALAALCDQRERAHLFHLSRECYARHNGNHADARFRPLRHVLAGIARAGGDDLDALLNHDVGYLVGKRTHEHDVDAEGLVGQLLALADFRAELLAVGVHRSNQSQSARVGNARGKRGVGYPSHTALKDGIFQTESLVNDSRNHM